MLPVALGLAGCVRTTSASVQFSPPPRVQPAPQTRPAPTLLSAHFALDDAPQLEGRDAIALVFSEEVDAASLRPDAFMVLLADGGRVLATDAFLAPASEADENRTVWIVGDFGDPRRRPPTDVLVIRALHAENGASLKGLLSAVLGYDDGGRIVFAQIQPEPCDAGGLRVRTFWSDGLRDVDADDLPSVALELVGGRTVEPVAFEDHREHGDFIGESRDDNVLDLCVPHSERVVGVRVKAGAFTDVPGHPSAATRATVARAPAPE